MSRGLILLMMMSLAWPIEGIAHTWRVALFHWAADATRFEWGGTAPGGLATIEDVRSAILSGAIKDPAGLW